MLRPHEKVGLRASFVPILVRLSSIDTSFISCNASLSIDSVLECRCVKAFCIHVNIASKNTHRNFTDTSIIVRFPVS